MVNANISLQAYIFFLFFQGVALYIINFAEIVYHQNKVLYIIKTKFCISSKRSFVYHQTAGKGMHGYAVMIYSSKGADEMHAKA